MTVFWSTLILNCFIAFGIIVGASIFAGLAAIVNNHPPAKTIVNVADSLKVWAVAVALGGTFQPIEALDQGLFRGELRSIVRQLIYIAAALVGANAGYGFILLLQKCGRLWND